MARDSGFRIRDSRLKNRSMKCISRKKCKSLEYQSMCPQYSYYKPFISLKKFGLSYAGAFHKNSLSVACCTFNVLEFRTITPNRFKNQSGGTLKILAHDCNHQQGFSKQKMVALHHCGFKADFPKHFY